MTNRQAAILGAMIPQDVAEVLLAVGNRDMDNIPGASIDYLKQFKLIERTKNLITGEMIWVVTADGKKVRKHLAAG